MVDTVFHAGPFARAVSLGALAMALSFPHAARAGDAALSPGDILVTGGGLEETPGTPVYSSIAIEREEIVTAPSGRIEDVLSAIAGFQQYRRSDSRSSNPTAQGVTLRSLGGNATSRALVLLDGVPMAEPFFGYVPLGALSPDSLGAIRVTRGGGSGPFGGGALTGTIELESRDGAGREGGGPIAASLLANQRGGTEASASIAPRLGSGFLVLSGRWDRGQGFWTTPAEQRVGQSVRAAYESWSLGLRAVAPLAQDLELQARGLVFRDRRTLRFAGADSAIGGEDASLRLVGRGDWQFDALAYVQLRDFSNVVISSSRFTPVLDQYATPATGLGAKFELRPPTGKDHTVRLGIDWRRAQGTMKEIAISAFSGSVTARRRAGGDNSDFGIFLEDDWRLGPLVLTGGLRADRMVIANGFYEVRSDTGQLVERTDHRDRAGWNVSWRGGARIALGSGLALRGAAYSGLRMPTLNELYRPFVVFPVVTEANAALKNETLTGFEAGLDFAPASNIAFSVTAFDNRIRNAIANVTLEQNLRQRRNLPAIDAQGVEFEAHLASGPVRFDGSLAWSDASVEGRGISAELDGMRPAQTPRLAASATLGLAPASGWLLALTLRHVSRQFEDDLETDVLPAATTLGAFFEMPVMAGASLVLRGENLFDETIVTRNSGGSLDLGVPRTVWAGLRWNM